MTICNTQLWDDFYEDRVRVHCRDADDVDLVKAVLEEIYPYGNYEYVHRRYVFTYPYILSEKDTHFCMSTGDSVVGSIKAEEFVKQIMGVGDEVELSDDISLEGLL